MTPKETHRQNCPCRCKDKNTCHEKAYQGKPDSTIKAKQCDSKCKYMANFNGKGES